MGFNVNKPIEKDLFVCYLFIVVSLMYISFQTVEM